MKTKQILAGLMAGVMAFAGFVGFSAVGLGGVTTNATPNAEQTKLEFTKTFYTISPVFWAEDKATKENPVVDLGIKLTVNGEEVTDPAELAKIQYTGFVKSANMSELGAYAKVKTLSDFGSFSGTKLTVTSLTEFPYNQSSAAVFSASYNGVKSVNDAVAVISGDIDGNGIVAVGDLSMTANMIMVEGRLLSVAGTHTLSIFTQGATFDLNGDGYVTEADVSLGAICVRGQVAAPSGYYFAPEKYFDLPTANIYGTNSDIEIPVHIKGIDTMVFDPTHGVDIAFTHTNKENGSDIYIKTDNGPVSIKTAGTVTIKGKEYTLKDYTTDYTTADAYYINLSGMPEGGVDFVVKTKSGSTAETYVLGTYVGNGGRNAFGTEYDERSSMSPFAAMAVDAYVYSSRKSVPVTFIGKDGETFATVNAPEFSTVAELPEAPVVEGFEFVNYTLPDGTVFDSDYVIGNSEEVAGYKVQANYKSTIVPVHFEDKEGTLLTGTGYDNATSATIAAGEIPEAPAVEGYDFLGWSKDGGNTYLTKETLITEETTFKATYKKVSAVVSATTDITKIVIQNDKTSVIPEGFAFSIEKNDVQYGPIGMNKDAMPEPSNKTFTIGDKAAWGEAVDSDNDTNKDMTVAFNPGITFTKTGSYSYLLKETAGSATGMTYSKEAYLITYNIIFDETDPSGEAMLIRDVLVSKIADVDGDAIDPAQKVEAPSFTNKYDTTTLKVEKTVNGSLGERSQAFEFEITIDDAEDHIVQVFNLDGTKADDEKTTKDGKVAVSLKHGQNAVVYGLVGDTAYTVKEANDAAGSVYTTSTKITTGGVAGEATVSEAGEAAKTVTGKVSLDGENIASYVNTRNLEVLTGARNTTITFAIILAAFAVTGISIVVYKKKKNA